jgi:preprotein translocase subunit SecF
MELFKTPKIDFIGLRWLPIGISFVVVAASVASIATKGFNYSIEFTGGTLVQVSFPAGTAINVDHVRKALEAKKLSPEIQSVTADKPTFILREKVASEAETDALVAATLEALKGAAPGATLDRKDVIGPVVGKDLKRRTLWAIVLSLLGIVVYVAFRFDNPVWGLAGVIALFHDVIGVAGLFSFLQLEMDLLIVTALITIAGYSMNDTIVIFDRMREKAHVQRGIGLVPLINDSMNETLSRTLITVLTVQIVCIVLLIWGGPVLHNFGLAMVFGNILGTYSSIGVAAPLVYEYYTRFTNRKVGESSSEAPAPAQPSLKVKEGRRRK